MTEEARKHAGAYYTPEPTVKALVGWAVHRPQDHMLDPACGDGRFLAHHANSTGIEQDFLAARLATQRVRTATVRQACFFDWAAQTSNRFDCAAGNPPFIRFQRFAGDVREAALSLCSRLGADFSSLSSSWAPFLVATASLLRPGGRMAFVVPAEIGHAPYAIPLLEYLVRHFDRVQIIAVREKLFTELNEDCWLLYADGFGGSTSQIVLSALACFEGMKQPPKATLTVSMGEWRAWNCRLRPFLMTPAARSIYQAVAHARDTRRLGEVAKVGIGYVTGANDFFHLRPSQGTALRIPDSLLHPSVRNGKALADTVTLPVVRRWLLDDEPVLLLRLGRDDELPREVERYLQSPEAIEAKSSYKCRNRDPWYVVPDVTIPDAFLSYMSGDGPLLVANSARCVCTNSVHAVHLNGTMTIDELQLRWADPLAQLSCEVEGHPLGGGMLKVEPREAARILLPKGKRSRADSRALAAAAQTLRQWRHYG
jgi:hypothetical protein